MKQKITILFLLFSLVSFSQIPANYYDTATGTGATLKTNLKKIIDNNSDGIASEHIAIDQGYSGLWITYQTSDIDHQYENDGTIMDIYSENPSGADPYNFTYGTGQCGTYSSEGNCYNREHMIPQSVFASVNPIHNDAHFITATDGKVNGERSNYPHGNVAVATITTLNGSKLGSSAIPGYTGTVFEPINEFKGDIARMYFYFVTRYESTVASYSYPAFSGNAYPAIDSAFLNMLKTWSTNDLVSAREIERNNAIYARQNNRNPYIDHPEYVDLVWPSIVCGPDTIVPTAPTALAVTGTTSTTISLSWTASTDNVGVTNYDIYVDGVKYASSGGATSITITGLTPSTTYNIYVVAKDCQGNISSASNILNPTTSTIVPGSASDLFFSEYVEGTSNNKALEIINITGSALDLSAYSIKRQTNGSGAWSSGLTLSGNLDDGSVYFITNTATASPCIPSRAANLSTGVGEMTFNGNDPMGLFKSGVLIDIIGTLDGGAANFSIDETLRRKSTVTSPNTTFNKAAEWDIFSVNTCDGLGDALLNTGNFTVSNFKIYPNPSSNGKFSIEFEEDGNYSIEIFSMLGQRVYDLKNINKKNIEINSLQQGIYLVKVTKENISIVKKIVIN